MKRTATVGLPWAKSAPRLLPVVTGLLLVGGLPAPPSAAAQDPGKTRPAGPRRCEKTFGKAWNTDWGQMVVCLCDGGVTGIYAHRPPGHGPGTFRGTVTGNTLEAAWKDAGGEGTFRLSLSDDGCTFRGTFAANLGPTRRESGPLNGNDVNHGTIGTGPPTAARPGEPGTGRTAAPWPGSTRPGHAGPDAGTGAAPPAHAGPATPVGEMTLLAEHREVQPGAVVTVPVWLLKGNVLAHLDFTVRYDRRVAVLEGVPARGNLLGPAQLSANPEGEGLARLGVSGRGGLKGNGTVANLVFRAVGPAGSSTPLHLVVTTAAGPGQAGLPVATVDGSIRILGPGEGLRGDCNGDGVLDARDAQCALDMSTGLLREDRNVDMDGDGNVTAVDATLILQDRSRTLLSQGR